MSFTKRAAMVAMAGLLLATPLLSSAQSTDPQITELLARVRELQARIAAIRGTPVIPPPPSTSCANLTANMHLRSTDAGTNGQVTVLQNYLIANGYMTGPATGYFGPVTGNAVGKLQLSLGIVTSYNDPNYSYVGPRTRGAIACTGKGSLSAIPSSGRAPLSVAFSGSLSGTSYFGGVKLDPGTGAEAQPVCDPSASCGSFKIGYVYQNVGTYTAKLLGLGEGVLSQVLGTATIVVTSASTTAPSAIIDPRSLFTTSANPTIYGTAQNVSSVILKIARGAYTSVTAPLAVTNGKWSYTETTTPFSPGSYPVEAVNGTTLEALATGTLVVSSSTTAAAIHVTPTTAAPGTSVTVSWSGIASPTLNDWIGLYKVGEPLDASHYASYEYVNCLKYPTVAVPAGSCQYPIGATVPLGDYNFVLFPNNLYTPLAKSEVLHIDAGAPTANLTVNGKEEIWVSVGSPLDYAWSSTNVASASSTYTVNTADVCPKTENSGGAFSLNANTRSGTRHIDAIHNCRYNRTYTVTYSVVGAYGQTASDSVVIHVSLAATLSASPNPCTIPLGGAQCSTTVSWNVPTPGQVVQVWTTSLASGSSWALFSCTTGASSKDAPWIAPEGATFRIFQTKTCDAAEKRSPVPDGTVTVTSVRAQ